MQFAFVWDEGKAQSNLRKHGVAFEEAISVFFDPLAKIFDDPDHSHDERREILVGHSTAARLLLVSFVARDGNVRVISARVATKAEREDYEESN